ncbi:MAG: class I SAM-dependent methyltransferase [Candidatus Solibacter sp.]
MTPTEAGLPALKYRLKVAWMAGDYDRYSRYLKTGAAEFYERLCIPPGAGLLDVGCGSGTLALMAARNGVVAAGVDIAPNWIERARCRAATDRLKVDFREADAESLPFADAQFDFVTSMFGGMFAPQPDLVAKEMARVCRSGGAIAMSNWTPGGFAGQMYRIIARYVPTPMMTSPFLWGDEAVARQRLQPYVSSLRASRRTYIFEYPYPPASVVEFFRENYGPVVAAFGHLDCTGRRALRAELDLLWTKWNNCPHGTTCVHSDALELIATRA